MLFNTFQFAYFFAILFPVYWALKRYHKAQNLLLLLAGYFFYACWDWKFLGLLMLSTVMDYACGDRGRPDRGAGQAEDVRVLQHGPEPGRARITSNITTSSPPR